MRNLLLATALLLSSISWAQPYLIGSRTITFYDPSRDRDIGTNIYYPGVTAGANAVVLNGQWPVLVMGHGFLMGTGSYSNIWQYFTPRGYIVALPTTEGGLPPNHGAFGLDLAFVAQALQEANVDASSPFFGKVAPASALMGHSMGGGASFLGAANNASIQALVNFAAAETNPSAVAAAGNVQVPTLMFAGSDDCVTPIAGHQGPMYSALNVPCRAFVNITGGSHCQFAQSDFTCSLGELGCSAGISRAAQHAVMNDFAGLWLDHFLKGVPGALAAVLDSLNTTTRAVTDHFCVTTAVMGTDHPELTLAPVPCDDRLLLLNATPGSGVTVMDLTGRVVLPARRLSSDLALDTQPLSVGTYMLLVEAGTTRTLRSFVVAR